VVQRPPTPRGSILHLLEHRLDQKLAPVGRDDPLIGPFRPVADQDGLAQMCLRDAIEGVGIDGVGQLRVALGVVLDGHWDDLLEVLAAQNRPALLCHRRQGWSLAPLDQPGSAPRQPTLEFGQPFGAVPK
jgi:hypothetical protein